jgi:hypothetical protein
MNRSILRFKKAFDHLQEYQQINENRYTHHPISAILYQYDTSVNGFASIKILYRHTCIIRNLS